MTVGIVAQIAWLMLWDTETTPDEGGPPYPSHDVAGYIVVGSIGAALLFCAVLLYVPDGIRRGRRAYRERQEFKDRFG